MTDAAANQRTNSFYTMSTAIQSELAQEEPPAASLGDIRPRPPAWIEIDVARLRRNYQVINQDKLKALKILAVVKDEAYGHGALIVARTALAAGASFLGLAALEEAMRLRDHGLRARMLLFGERQEAELPWCVEHDLTVCVNDRRMAEKLGQIAARAGRRVPVHLKINTGMNRYGVRWSEALALAEAVSAIKSLELEGVMSHFSMSDEMDKTFALQQLARFNEVLSAMAARGIAVKYRHLCNSGGFLDLPQAHFDMVRIGMLQHGVFPSQVCRRIAGIEPTMTVKARVAAIQRLEKDDVVGYGMKYKAPSARRIAVIPVGYGDGFPRVRNQGCVLIGGRRAPLVGGVAMDAFMVDTTGLPEVRLRDEVVLMGRQGAEEISADEVAQWKNSVSYDVLTGWRSRLPRIHVNGDPDP
jgi:alanine racemase